MKTRWVLLLLLLIPSLLLPGCGQRGLDAETQALAEASDAVCMVQFRVTELVQAPDGLEGNWQTTQDGTKWAHLLTFRLTADFFGNLTSRGIFFKGSCGYIYILADLDLYREIMSSKSQDLLLFLDILPGYTHQPGYANRKYLVFRVHGPDGAGKKITDKNGLRLLDALRAYGKDNPRKLIPYAACP